MGGSYSKSCLQNTLNASPTEQIPIGVFDNAIKLCKNSKENFGTQTERNWIWIIVSIAIILILIYLFQNQKSLNF